MRYTEFRDQRSLPMEDFIIRENHPRDLPSSYEKGALDISIMSCSRPELLSRTLGSLTEWFRASNKYPTEKVRLNVWENSDNPECREIVERCADLMGIEGRVDSWGRNIGIYPALRNVWNMGTAEFVWTIEDDWYVGSTCDLIRGYIDIFESDPLVDAIFIQYPLIDFCFYSKEVIKSLDGLEYRYVRHGTSSVYGKWATPIIFRRDILDAFVGGAVPPAHLNYEGEAFLCQILNNKINTAVLEDTGHYPMEHIGIGSSLWNEGMVVRPIEPPVGIEMAIYTLPHRRK